MPGQEHVRNHEDTKTRSVTNRAPIIGLLVLSAALFACRRTPPAHGADRPPVSAVVLVTIDTLRADRLGVYGSRLGLTPTLDRFARDATRFTAAVTQVPLTLPAHATILTGLHPARHGVRTNDGFRLAASVPTLAEALRARGFATGAFIGGFPLRADTGLARGFDRYDDEFLRRAGATERPADEVVNAAATWIEGHRTQPFFVWVHLFDPHSPYTPPEPFASAHRDAPYDGEVAYADAALGRFFARLQQLDVLSRSAVVVVADHGEALGEHGERTHGTFLYDATVRIPLLIRTPGMRGARVVDAPVEAADLAPTVAALAGASLASVDGRSLVPVLDGAAGDPDRAAYSESFYQYVLLGWSPLRSVRTSRWKFIEAPRPELYDLAADPGEHQNRIAERGSLATALQHALPAQNDAAPSAASTREASERLRSLGYASGATAPTSLAERIDPKDRIDVWGDIEDGIDRMTHDPDGARAAFARALRRDPSNGLAMKYLADISFRAGRLQDARDGYRRAIAAGFRHPDAFVNLAAIAEREGRFDEARAALDEAVTLAPSDADAWNRVGMLDVRAGAVDRARRAFESAISAAPDRPEPYYNLALLDRQAGNEQAARTRLADAIERDPAYPEAHYELGTGYLRDRQSARALDEYRAALAARPDYPEALFGAARAALDLGRFDEAARDYRRFIEVAPREYAPQVAAARDALRTLGTSR